MAADSFKSTAGLPWNSDPGTWSPFRRERRQDGSSTLSSESSGSTAEPSACGSLRADGGGLGRASGDEEPPVAIGQDAEVRAGVAVLGKERVVQLVLRHDRQQELPLIGR